MSSQATSDPLRFCRGSREQTVFLEHAADSSTSRRFFLPSPWLSLGFRGTTAYHPRIIIPHMGKYKLSADPYPAKPLAFGAPEDIPS